MLRASDISNHSPHNIGNENDPLVRRSRWLNDSFPGLLLPDQIWGEAIKASRLWEEWGPTGVVRDPVFCRLLANRVWDSDESNRPNTVVMAMRHSATLSSRLMLRALEQEEKVFSSCSSEDYSSDTRELQHDKLEREWRSFKKEMSLGTNTDLLIR